MEFVSTATAAYYAAFNSGVYLMPMMKRVVADFVESFFIARGIIK